MASKNKSRGATRKPVPKQKQTIAWKKGFKGSVLVSMIAGLTAAIIWLQQEDTLPILHVTVDGQFEHVDKALLVEAVTPYVTGNFINIDVAKLREAGEAAPWVKLIQVKRSWPDTVHLVVEEQRAIAQWGQYGLVNNEGELFFPAKASFPSGLVLLRGPEETSELMLNQFMQISELFTSRDLAVTKIEMDQRRSWNLKLSNGMEVKLGRADSQERLQRFVRIFNTVLFDFKNKIKTVDMRYTNGLTIDWKSGEQPRFNEAV